MNEGRNRIGQRKMRREDYKAVKKMDRQQFEAFCKTLYEEGQQSVLEVRNSIDFDDVRAVLMEVKGIGQKRADQIMLALEKRMEGK